MKKIKVIDLLNMIAEGKELPIKIKYEYRTYIYSVVNAEYYEEGHYENYNNKLFAHENLQRHSVLNDYVEIIAPILDDAEKEYLSAVIKPFRDRVISIEKLPFYNEEEYISINIKIENTYQSDSFSLPTFEKDTMYKGMEVDKEYTLKELGL